MLPIFPSYLSLLHLILKLPAIPHKGKECRGHCDPQAGKTIHEADLAKEHGQTLCGYALHLAMRELYRLRNTPYNKSDA